MEINIDFIIQCMELKYVFLMFVFEGDYKQTHMASKLFNLSLLWHQNYLSWKWLVTFFSFCIHYEISYCAVVETQVCDNEWSHFSCVYYSGLDIFTSYKVWKLESCSSRNWVCKMIVAFCASMILIQPEPYRRGFFKPYVVIKIYIL